MSSLIDQQNNCDVPVLIRQSSLETARAFAAETNDAARSEQIFLNTLSVLSVHEYLKILGIATDVTQGDSWQPRLRLIDNPTDLHVVERGSVECLPTAPNSSKVSIGPDVQFRRLAYLVVELKEPFQAANIKGFGTVSEIADDMLSLEQLHPITDLPRHLTKFHASQLERWFQGNVESIWQPPEQIIATHYPAFRFRAPSEPILRKARLITLKCDIGSPLQLGLVIAAKPSNGSIYVSAQLHPGIKENIESDSNRTLPAGVVLELRSDEEEIIQAVAARSTPADNFIQLKPFECLAGDQYQIRVSWNQQEVFEILSF